MNMKPIEEIWKSRGWLTIPERAINHNLRFKSNPPLAYNSRWITGYWYFFRSKGDKYYGGYPNKYLDKVFSLFPDIQSERILHLFSGGLRNDVKGSRFDIKQVNDNIVGDVMNIDSMFTEKSFDLVIADPPYESKDFDRYKCKQFNKRIVVNDKISKIVNSQGFLIWLDLLIPFHSSKIWSMVGLIGVAQGVGMRGRTMTILRRVNL